LRTKSEEQSCFLQLSVSFCLKQHLLKSKNKEETSRNLLNPAELCANMLKPEMRLFAHYTFVQANHLKMEKQQETKFRIHPEAVKNLSDQSWDFMCKAYWKQQVLSEEEKAFVKSCISEYYCSIPPETFSEKSSVYLRIFRWQILRAKENSTAKSDLKMFAPLVYLVWKKYRSKEISSQRA